jgi:hypothetical protein
MWQIQRKILQVLTAASKKLTTFSDIAPCSLVEVDWRFRGHRSDVGGSKHIWNVSPLLRDHTAHYHTRLSSLKKMCSQRSKVALFVESSRKYCLWFNYYARLFSVFNVRWLWYACKFEFKVFLKSRTGEMNKMGGIKKSRPFKIISSTKLNYYLAASLWPYELMSWVWYFICMFDLKLNFFLHHVDDRHLILHTCKMQS